MSEGMDWEKAAGVVASALAAKLELDQARRVAAILFGALEDLLDDLDDTPAEVRDMMGQLAARFPWLKETTDD